MITLLEILSDNPIENVITCMRYRVDKVVFFGPADLMEKYFETSSAFLKAVCGVADVKSAETEPHSLDGTIAVMSSVIAGFGKEERVFLDVTGGSDTALIAAGIVSEKYAIPLHSFDVKSGELFFLKDRPNAKISEAAAERTVSCSIDDYIKLHGGAINYHLHKSKKGKDMLENEAAVLKLISIYKHHKAVWAAFSSFIAKKTGKESLSFNASADKLKKMLRTEFPQIGSVKTLKQILGELRSAGLLSEYRYKEEVCRFSFKSAFVQDVISETGCVLEMIAYLAEKEQSDDCVIGCHIDWDGVIHEAGDVINEIDVISIRNGIPCFVSCKSGTLQGVNYARALNELYLLAEKFGGKYARKKLYVSSGLCETSPSNLTRAREMGIELVEVG